jgi:Protein of unknown function (DUF1501)
MTIPSCTGTRREFLWQLGAGFGSVALTSLLDGDGFFAGRAQASTAGNPLAPRPPHFPARAKHCIFIFMYGGPSQVDTFDYKPELQKRDGQTVDIEIRRHTIRKEKLQASKRTFARHGQSGQWCSDAFPLIAGHMDELCVIKSLYTDTFAHGSAMIQMNSGRVLQGWPALGSWP